MKALVAWLFALIPCVHAAATEIAATSPYATINWAEPLNPRLINAGGDRFIVLTRAGVQVWDAAANKLAPGTGWPVHTALGYSWVRLGGGTLLEGSAHDARDTELHTLVWWNPATSSFPTALALPAGQFVADLVPVDPQYALVCVRRFDPDMPRPVDFDAKPPLARLVTIANGELRWSEVVPASLRETMLAAGIRGKVEGAGTLAPAGDAAPLAYDTASCSWTMRPLPAQMASMRNVVIKPQRLPDGRMVVAHADWTDPNDKARGPLRAPLLWDAAARRWQQLAGPGDRPDGPSVVRHFGMDDPIVSATTINSPDVELLDPVTLRWRRFGPALPQHSRVAGIAPLETGDALVFMSMERTVYRLHAPRTPPPGDLAYPHAFPGEVQLPGNGLMLLNGGDEWYGQNKPEIVRVSQQALATSIAPMALSLHDMSGVALGDGTVLAFGGLRPGCAGESADPDHCRKLPVPPALRYFPAQDRWEEVPGLHIPHALGASWNGGGADFTTAWPRTDVRVRKDGQLVAVLEPDVPDEGGDPLPGKVLGWRPGTQPVALPSLLHARIQSTLLELDDGRMAVLGGFAQPVRIALEPACEGCPDEFVSYGSMAPARMTETMDASLKEWKPGPRAHFGGGTGVKLASGRIFKMSFTDAPEEERRLQAETSDAAFTHWTALPLFPLKDFTVQHMAAIGNRVLVLEQAPGTRTVVWDDAAARWLVWKGWQGDQVYSASEAPGGKVLLRYRDRVAVVSIPVQEPAK